MSPGTNGVAAVGPFALIFPAVVPARPGSLGVEGVASLAATEATFPDVGTTVAPRLARSGRDPGAALFAAACAARGDGGACFPTDRLEDCFDLDFACDSGGRCGWAGPTVLEFRGCDPPAGALVRERRSRVAAAFLAGAVAVGAARSSSIPNIAPRSASPSEPDDCPPNSRSSASAVAACETSSA